MVIASTAAPPPPRPAARLGRPKETENIWTMEGGGRGGSRGGGGRAGGPTVTAVPWRNRLRYWSSAPKSSRYPIAGSEVRRQRQIEPLLRNLVQAAVLLHLRDRVVELLLQARLVLVEADMIGRVHQLELLLRLDRRMLGQDGGADVVADHHELDLARQERRDHAVIVIEALDVGAGRRHFGHRGVLER